MPRALAYEENGVVTGYMVFCPACQCGHLFNLTPGSNGMPGGKKSVWTFVNKDVEKPTFVHSMLVKSIAMPEVDPETGDYPRGADGKYLLDTKKRIAGTTDTVCHSHVKNGTIQFLNDCTHALAGKTVDLPDFNELNAKGD